MIIRHLCKAVYSIKKSLHQLTVIILCAWRQKAEIGFWYHTGICTTKSCQNIKTIKSSFILCTFYCLKRMGTYMNSILELCEIVSSSIKNSKCLIYSHPSCLHKLHLLLFLCYFYWSWINTFYAFELTFSLPEHPYRSPNILISFAWQGTSKFTSVLLCRRKIAHCHQRNTLSMNSSLLWHLAALIHLIDFCPQ